MKNLIKAVILLITFQLLASYTNAQTNNAFLQKTVETLDKQSAVLPIEKAYLQTDKPVYAAGDTIWFKGYVTIGALHRLSAKSSLLNVQLINSRAEVVQYLKLQLNNGVCSGNIALPDSLEAGAYQIRAYTNWMRNFADDYFFEKNITIGNAITNDLFTKAAYSYKRNSQGQQLNAGISYASLSGNPYSGKEVKYSIIKGTKTIFKNKDVTDNNGNLKINYQSPDTSFFDKGAIRTNIYLGKTSVAKDISIKIDKNPVSVQFFPEGGYLVNGQQSTVAFKSIGNDGLGKDVTGVITDNDNKEVAQLKSERLGMGKFTFIPQSGKTYKAKIGDNIVALPVARNDGYIMAVDNSDTSKITITISGADVQTLNLVARSGGLACYAAALKMQGEPVVIRIPKNKFPSGVAQFTLFSASGEPLNERLAFISHREEILDLQLNANKNSYKTREKININLHAQNIRSKPVVGSFSAAVINETDIEGAETDESSILSALLLTSGIKGNIEQPGYYFNETSTKVQNDLDLLMLTQGYRGFEWKEITDGKIQDAVYVPEKSLTISGILKTPGGKPVPNGKIRLFTTTGPLIMVDTVSDAAGKFKFSGMEFRDSTKFVLQANNEKGKSNVIIEINKDEPAFKNAGYTIEADKDSIPLAYLQNSKKQYLDDIKYGTNNHSTLLKEVVITEKKPEIRSSNLSGPGHYSQIIMAKELESCTTLATCLIPRLHGVVIDREGTPHSPRNRTMANGKLLDVMMVLLDGVELSNLHGSPFDLVNPSDVASIELLHDPADLAIYGIRGSFGIIIINTKKGDEEPEHFFKAMNVLNFSPKGYYVARKFYAPQYDVARNNHKPDLRSTIFWKPDVFTDLKGNASFSYFNADGKGTYRVVIEGIDDDGNIGRQVLRYEVK